MRALTEHVADISWGQRPVMITVVGCGGTGAQVAMGLLDLVWSKNPICMNFQVREPHGANSDNANRVAFGRRAAVDHTVLAPSHAFQNPMRTTEIRCVGTTSGQTPESRIMIVKKDAVRDFHDHDMPFSRRPPGRVDPVPPVMRR